MRLSGVSRSFPTPTGQHHVLRDVDLSIGAGEIVALIGASGCGKSTLLREIGGLDRPDAGRDRHRRPARARLDARCAVAFQEPRLLPWRTVRDNVGSACRAAPPAPPARDRVDELLELVGLTDAADHRPREVSGGMAQRASLARALARNPGVLLLDEPFGALDALTRLKMQDLLLDIHAAEPTTVLLVTHDVEEALYLADRVVAASAARHRRPRLRGAARLITRARATARATGPTPPWPTCALELLDGPRRPAPTTDHRSHPHAARPHRTAPITETRKPPMSTRRLSPPLAAVATARPPSPC